MKIPRINKGKKGRIEIIPMIDVMFFLLATILMASIAMQKVSGIMVNLTQEKTTKTLEKNENVATISITHDNLIYINEKITNITKISEYLVKNNIDKKNIFIASDSEAKHGIVAQVMIEAKKAGIKKFTIMTKN